MNSERRGDSKRGGAAPFKSLPPVPPPPNEVLHADILTEVYAIASLALQVQVCQ